MISVDLHLHTCHSHDCATPVERVIGGARRANLDCVAITDHNTIEGALQLRASGELRVIVGEEIGTSEGELIGLFLIEPVPKGLSPLETIARIKEQGGLVCIPHPFGRKRVSANLELGAWRDGRFVPSRDVVRANRILNEDVLSRVDLIEAVNSRTFFRNSWTAASRLAEACGLSVTAGSDAHTVREIGRSRVEMPDFTDAESFLKAIADARPFGVRSSLLIHFASMYARVVRDKC